MPVSMPTTRRWTRREYRRMGEAGLFEGQRVELVAGNIVEMSPHGTQHAVSIGLVQNALAGVFGADCSVRIQLPLAVSPDTELEPDVAVVPGSPRDYLNDHPSTAMLVVEVADTTLAYDTTTKSAMYAAAGVEDYWVINLGQRRVEVFRRPVADHDAPSGFRYEDRTSHSPDDSLAPLARPDARLSVADVLP